MAATTGPSVGEKNMLALVIRLYFGGHQYNGQKNLCGEGAGACLYLGL